MPTELKQDQAVELGEVDVLKAGEEIEEVETAATETPDNQGLLESASGQEGITVDDIMSEETPAGEEVVDAIGEVEGVTPEAQERINRKIGSAVKDKKLAQEGERKALKRVEELEEAQSAPKERPLVPLVEEFETTEEYQEAMNKYQDDTIAFNNVQQSVKIRKEEDDNRKGQNVSRFMKRSERLRDKFNDFDALVITDNPDGSNPFGNIADLVLNAEYNAEVGYFLRKNPDEMDRLQSLDRNSALLEIGALSGRFKPTQKKKTTAPKALSTIKGATETVVADIKDIKDPNAWFRARNAQILKEQET